MLVVQVAVALAELHQLLGRQELQILAVVVAVLDLILLALAQAALVSFFSSGHSL